MKLNKKIFSYFGSRKDEGTFVLQGGRRSGKTYAICQRILLLCYQHHRIANIASMTQEQGRLGAYADMKEIIASEPLLEKVFTVNVTPREIRNTYNGSRIFFNSYQNSETAKGVACDYLFLNEANNFSKQQYIDLLANVRKSVFLDYNPNIEFWVSEFFKPEDILITTWRDNPFLTPLQKEYFVQLKQRAFAENATGMDRYLYSVYYLGEHSEFLGTLFTPDNIQRADLPPADCNEYFIYCDPSAMVGNDYFACVLVTFSPYAKKLYILDTLSVNKETKEYIIQKLKTWCLSYDDVNIFVETNGIIGQDFYKYLVNSDFPAYPLYSRMNKFDRILANYEGITQNVVFVNNERTDEFLEQVYTFEEKCEHDDNIDCVNLAYGHLKSRIEFDNFC